MRINILPAAFFISCVTLFSCQKQVVKDSSFSTGLASYYYIQEYKYATGKIYGTSRSVPAHGILTDTATVDADGNVLLNKRYSDNYLNLTSEFTYDNKPSPFAKLSNHSTFAIFPSGETRVGEFRTVNNRLKAHEFSVGTYDEDFTGKYVFLSCGYPSSVKDPDPAAPGDYDEIIFTYKSL